MARRRKAAKTTATSIAPAATFTVESVLDSGPDPNRGPDAVQYLIKWEGWVDPTWEDDSNCEGCRGAVAEYLRDAAKKPSTVEDSDDEMQVEKQESEDESETDDEDDESDDDEDDTMDAAAKERRATRLGGTFVEEAVVSFAKTTECVPSGRRVWSSHSRFTAHHRPLWMGQLADEEEDRLMRLSELNYACLAMAMGELVKYTDVPRLRKPACGGLTGTADATAALNPGDTVRRYVIPEAFWPENMQTNESVVGACRPPLHLCHRSPPLQPVAPA